ncbi:hypothetical protein LGM89_21610 [Burkholderia sp. AU31624]|uniref:hypothetical protein n=1 Tax=Burkholderia sp. AU31624 TaxID=2879629 RepID=UPI001CF20A0A|nr:hypothetical protein [Burkholderia sp. AU31624]MCA8255864.1 hypothetical protein [Burkholderia sp. AU31624]
MTAHLLNGIGLFANMTGVALAFFFGFPQPDHREGDFLMATDATVMPDGLTVGEHNKQKLRRKLIYKIMSLVALGLMFAGFAAQFAALRFE